MRSGILHRRFSPGGALVCGNDCFADTDQLVAAPATKVVCGAAFRAGTLIVEVDFLVRDGAGWNVVQVKPSFPDSSSIDDYVDSLAYAAMVLHRAAVTVKGLSLLLLSRNYRHGDPVEKLFTLVDKTNEVDKRAQKFDRGIDAIADAVRAEVRPQPVLNRFCWGCDFFKTSCLGSGRGHTVVELPRLHRTRIKALSNQGIIDIADIPNDVKLNDMQKRAKAAMESGSIVVEAEGLALC